MLPGGLGSHGKAKEQAVTGDLEPSGVKKIKKLPKDKITQSEPHMT